MICMVRYKPAIWRYSGALAGDIAAIGGMDRRIAPHTICQYGDAISGQEEREVASACVRRWQLHNQVEILPTWLTLH